ncbi:MAG TPA: hypothetical protein VLA24_15235, partial [Pseudomonadales bacterium]|nr:hypothetical protein [Pseudomonadales bacterium]
MDNASHLPSDFDPKRLIKALGKGIKGARALTLLEAKQLILGFALGQVNAPQMASAMMLMRLRGETVTEMAGVALGLKATVNEGWRQLKPQLDWPVFAGKRDQLPWLLLAAKALASQGITIVLHGDELALPHRSHVGKYIEALDIPLANQVEQAKMALFTHGIVYVPVSAYLPVADQCRALHQTLGLRSLVQMSVRCINPFSATTSLRSYFHPGVDIHHWQVAEMMAQHDLASPNQVVIFKGQQGETEINPRVATKVIVITKATVAVQSPVEFELPTLLEGLLRADVLVPFEKRTADTLRQYWLGLAETDRAAIDKQAYFSVIGTLMVCLFGLTPATTVAQALESAQKLWQQRHDFSHKARVLMDQQRV